MYSIYKSTATHTCHGCPYRVEALNISYQSETLRRVQNPVYEETPAGRATPPREREEGEEEEEGPTYEIIPLAVVVNGKKRKTDDDTPVTAEDTNTTHQG